jgi:hypothetical protein
MRLGQIQRAHRWRGSLTKSHPATLCIHKNGNDHLVRLTQQPIELPQVPRAKPTPKTEPIGWYRAIGSYWFFIQNDFITPTQLGSIPDNPDQA